MKIGSRRFFLVYFDFAGFCLAYFGSGGVFGSLFWISQGFWSLILDHANVFQLILGLAGFLSAYFGPRKVFVSLFWISQGFW